MSHPKFGALLQQAVVCDIFPVGCAFDKSNVQWKYFEGNEDWNNPKYNLKNGMYAEGCGLENVLMSWGHDDYMYLVAKENKTTLPSVALFIICYHSFYHKCLFFIKNHLMNDEGRKNMKWLRLFNYVTDLDKGKGLYFLFVKSETKTQGGLVARQVLTSYYKSEQFKSRPYDPFLVYKPYCYNFVC